MSEEPTNLTQLLDQIEDAIDKKEEDVSLGEILDTVGRRSFGPLLLICLVTIAPILGDIPGVPTIMGILILLIGSQLLFQYDHFWLPDWLLRQSVGKDKLKKGLQWMHSPARFSDHWLRPRLTMVTRGVGIYIIASVCIAIALVMPVMEVIPFSATIAGIALTAFGLALITRDGLMALLAFLFSAGTFGLIIYNLL
ncbi:exopolysaccharide biosynthesis protein [Aliifodinibius salicampi]|uniref:Exopolysaccharide biosynthesis protein n=1 Tax=Fodinibius salicampi TaxID=1920655 RepID=A0ABT3PX49_9BACT|nr:exopolysaccharide biosynthesis protein [Fodinibius salicampi]MCW9712415.1 exopolysaccharide biosynthesis protein [Fodinibius salicampi]